ncbi:PadR family transcriptional regulator [Acholeplasma equirhinis]|uniref:PadR family transcriptional regulator n=1 Tax=Acholeplasma equirhinis TaxID=555393 RepID=UPI00197A8310|nr:PadR family transcriptional regulator [Acholeplasma equirhinis]MBN3490199.1 PadR family transcriptional regulator [Acholeplasma equirhinis]
MNTQFKKGVIEICILKIVSEEDMYGFEIIDKLSHLLDVNENTIYPILRRLTEQNMFETYLRESSMGAARKYYRITDQGKKSLKEYQDEWQSFIENVMKILKGEIK